MPAPVVTVGGVARLLQSARELVPALDRAELTEAQYFHAASSDELKKVYQALSGKFVLAKEEREVTALAAALAALLALAAGAISLAWFNRL